MFDFLAGAAQRAADRQRHFDNERRKCEIEAECPVFLSLRMRRAAEYILGMEPLEAHGPSRVPTAETLDAAALPDGVARALAALLCRHGLPPAYAAHFLGKVGRRAFSSGRLSESSTEIYERLLGGFREYLTELSVSGIAWDVGGAPPWTFRPIELRALGGDADPDVTQDVVQDAAQDVPRPVWRWQRPELSTSSSRRRHSFRVDPEYRLSQLRHDSGESLQAWFGAGRDACTEPDTEAVRRACKQAAAAALTLPLVGQKEWIKRCVRENQVVLVQAETGSGKTTQVPQYILELFQEDVLSGAADPSEPIRIVCTQPRRIAAISVAHRVSTERGELFGGGTLGYKVRGESYCSSATRILYCTVGVLLRRLAVEGPDNMFSPLTVTHLVVDEIHERSCDVDFLLTFARRALPRNPKLRVILMSATIDAERLRAFFTREDESGKVIVPPLVALPGRLYPVEVVYRRQVEEIVFSSLSMRRAGQRVSEAEEESGYADEWRRQLDDGFPPERPGFGRRGGEARWRRFEDEDEEKDTVKDPIDFKLIAGLVSKIANSPEGVWGLLPWQRRPPAAQRLPRDSVLIFLPGVMEIQETMEALQREPGARLWRILPLHGALLADEQQRCFGTDWRASCRLKVICATNAAETSVTIPDVTVVIDSCVERRNQVDRYSNTPALREQYCAMDSLTQRCGRAGRVQPGVCFRLIREEFAMGLPTLTVPEMRRVPLENLYLQVCASGIDDRIGFLTQTPDPPEESAVFFAEAVLRDLGALDGAEPDGLTPLGRHLSMLPCNPRLGKILVLGCLLGCPAPCISIVSALSRRSPFITGLDQGVRDLWSRRRVRLASRHGCQRSDHCIWALLMLRWAVADRAEQDAISRYYGLAPERMRQAHSERKVLAGALIGTGLLPEDFVEREWESLGEGRLARRGAKAWQAAETPASRLAKGILALEAQGDADLGVAWEQDAELEETGWPSENIDWELVRAAVCGGLYPNVIKAERLPPPSALRHGPSEGRRFMHMWVRQWHHSMNEALSYVKPIDIHPASLCAREERFDCPYLVFFTCRHTKKLFALDVSEAAPLPLLLFGAEPVLDEETGHIEVGQWARLQCSSPQAVMAVVTAARAALRRALEEKLRDPTVDHSASRELGLCIAMLRTNGLGFCPAG